MAAKRTPGKEHRQITREAGIGPVSGISIVAGTLSAYGAFALIAALAGALLSAAEVETDFRSNDWTGSGAVAALASALVLLLAYLLGGYVAGRMARRAGLVHGVAVAISSLVLAAVVGGVVGGLADNQEVEDNLRSIGAPTTTDQITGVAITGLVVSLVALVIGAVLGGILGERWHTKLARRAADPDVGPAAESRARAEREDQERRRTIESDEPLRRETAGTDRRDPTEHERGRGDEPRVREGIEPDTSRDEPDTGRDEPRRTETRAPEQADAPHPDRPGDDDRPAAPTETPADDGGRGSSSLRGRRSKRRR